MEPRNEKSPKSPEHRKEVSKRRFQIVKLEERIAPGKCRICDRGGCETYVVKGRCPGK